MKKVYFRSILKLFSKHVVRLFSLSAIFIVSVGLCTGISSVKEDLERSIINSYKEDNIHDLYFKGSSEYINKVVEIIDNNKDLKDAFNDNRLYTISPLDIKDKDNEKYASRFSFFDVSKNQETANPIDKLELIEGKWPKFNGFNNNLEAVVERKTNDIKEHKIDEIIEYNMDFNGSNFVVNIKIVGIVKNPTCVALSYEPSHYYNESTHRYLNDIFYVQLSETFVKMSNTDLFLTFKNRDIFNAFSQKYIDLINNIKNNIEKEMPTLLKEGSMLSLLDCYSLKSLDEYAVRVHIISLIFIIFFALIAVLVSYSTISRLLDEEREDISVLKVLGSSNFAIIIRYLLFSFVGMLIGSIIAIGPSILVNRLIINGFKLQFVLSKYIFSTIPIYFYIISSICIGASLIFLIIRCYKYVHQKPVNLLKYKTPKEGKVIFLEKIKPIWSRLSFKYKSTLRNVFLFKSRFFMTVVSIIGVSMLVLASFALLDNTFKVELPGVNSLRTITIVLLIFSALLCAFVIYNITNINVSERSREIATLMVLGYKDKETAGYIYREIYILTIIGALLGLPLGYVFLLFIFKFINFGGVENVNWWTYIIVPLITFIFAFASAHLLHHKIININMNESLKTLE